MGLSGAEALALARIHTPAAHSYTQQPFKQHLNQASRWLSSAMLAAAPTASVFASRLPPFRKVSP
ncbi:hypothetical protein ASL22_17720 [Alcaligenes faecalis]|nr:hypothetical protein ASL22_17720 [Alcaligenes faecalis]